MIDNSAPAAQGETSELSLAQLVADIVCSADRALTLDEIKVRVEAYRPITSRNPRSTLRSAVYTNTPLVTSLGGRPAGYVWLPNHLMGATFRQPLAASDLAAGTLVLTRDVWTALWPEFRASGTRSRGDIVLALDGGPELATCIEHLVPMQAVWGLRPTPAIAKWYRRQGATEDDELILHVVDVDSRRCSITLCRRLGRNEPAIAARNQVLADAAEAIARTGPVTIADFDLIPRLIARDVYRHPLPPDALERVLCADLRFLGWPYGVSLARRMVDSLERDQELPLNRWNATLPRGNRHKVCTEGERRSWSDYLFDRGMEHLWSGYGVAAEAYYREAICTDPSHADAWVHLGNLRFREGRVLEALGHYERAQAAAEARAIGDPARYPAPFWLDLDSRPFMRALHGRGLCLWRLRRLADARQFFTLMLALNPNDNQGARFLLQDLDQGLSWEESSGESED